MKPVFIFADHVKKVVESGKQEIEIPEGARITAAAYDIIKDKKIRITYVADEKLAGNVEALEAEGNPAWGEESQDAPGEPGFETDERVTSPDATDEIPGDVLEDIVDRVIARFKQLKGHQSEKPAGNTSSEIEPEAGGAPEDDIVICRCEEITKEEIKEAIRNGMQTLNGIKRITRAGMGLCQGQTCQRLVAQILTEELGLAAADIDPTTARGPVRPLRLEVFANS